MNGFQDDPGVWQSCLDRLRPLGLGDIYFSRAYHQLNLCAADRATAFAYEDGGDLFFLPIVRRPAPPQSEGWFDAESAYGYGGPLSTSAQRGFLEAAWTAFLAAARRERIFCCFLRFHPLLENQRWALEPWVTACDQRATVWMALDTDEEAALAQYRADTRSKVRRAQSSAIEVTRLDGRDALRRFARLYRQTMMDVEAGAEYFFPDAYFDRIADTLAGQYSVFLATLDGREIGGVLTLQSERFVHLHLSATDRNTRGLGTANLLRHAAIVAHLGAGRTFHFGGGLTNDPADTLLQFKKGFAKETARFYIGKVTPEPAVYRAFCERWERAHPDGVGAAGTMFQKYRF
ncbi:MAG: GNAT family N-acetyltransferase [Acidobacteriia bacterium]|nr:GNAT family N-acetyltransferase [Terriglobia bacterium]